MNAITEFLRAKLFWATKSQTQKDLPETADTWDKINARMPVFKGDLFEPLPVPEVKDEEYGLHPYLKVPRHFGSDGEIQDKICDALRILTLNCLKEQRTNRLMDLMKAVGKPEDGGTFFDFLIGRGQGDTPIVICEFLTLSNFIAIRSVDNAIKYLYRDYFIDPFALYVFRYKTAQLNNHLTWKALFLATSAILTKDVELLKQSYFLFETALNQIAKDGSMPLELARGEKACSYTLMNLEALIQLENIFGTSSPKLELALKDWAFCLNNHDQWKKERKVGRQSHPDNLMEWGWVNGFFKKGNAYNRPLNAYVSLFSTCWNRPF